MDAMIGARRVTELARRSGVRLRCVWPRAWIIDAALAAGFLAAMLVERLFASPQIGARMPVALLLSLIIAGALAARRRAPLTAYLVGTVMMVVEAKFIFISTITPNADLIEAYSFGLYATRSRARLGPLIAVGGVVAYFHSINHLSVEDAAGPLILWLLAWAFGYGSARRQEEREAARLVVRQRDIADERAHIARELHDLVGHSLNVMLVQAGAARRVLDGDPEHTRELLTSLESTGRDAFEELDRVLGLLRLSTATPPATLAPPGGPAVPPGLDDLSRLTERIGEAGIRITVHIDPGAREVPRSIDISAYRIVQEALTNSVKHARADSADVTVRLRGRSLDIEVSDDGHGAVDGYATGRGLLGIHERVSMFGGSLEHGGGERGGFRLHAVLPIPR